MKPFAGLPTRNGVGASCVALPPGQWPSIVEFLAARFPTISRTQWLARMASGEVFDAAGTALAPNSLYRPYEKIFYYRSLPVEVRIPFEERILFQDDLIVAVDKPHFLPVTPSGNYLQETLLVRLKRSLGIDTLTPMHRLDRDTAGVVLFAVQPLTRNRYQALFRDRKILKRYEALAPRSDHLQFPMRYCSRLQESASFMQMEEVPGKPNAETTIELIALHGVLAKYCLSPTTGQKHQLRLHMSALGIPILNDRIYPTLLPAPSPSTAPDYSHPLQLVARTICFQDPITNAMRQFDSTCSLLMG